MRDGAYKRLAGGSGARDGNTRTGAALNTHDPVRDSAAADEKTRQDTAAVASSGQTSRGGRRVVANNDLPNTLPRSQEGPSGQDILRKSQPAGEPAPKRSRAKFKDTSSSDHTADLAADTSDGVSVLSRETPMRTNGGDGDEDCIQSEANDADLRPVQALSAGRQKGSGKGTMTTLGDTFQEKTGLAADRDE